MQKIDMSKFRNEFVKAVEATIQEALNKNREWIESEIVKTNPDFVSPPFDPEFEWNWHRIVNEIEELLDNALRDHSEQIEPERSVHGKLVQYKLSKDFVVQIDVTGSGQNNERLFQLHQDANVIITSAQGYLFGDEAQPEKAQVADGDNGQMDIEEAVPTGMSQEEYAAATE